MPRYTVTLSRSVQEFATLEVHATSELEAGIKAMAAEDRLDWETDYSTYGKVRVDDMDELDDDWTEEADDLYAIRAED